MLNYLDCDGKKKQIVIYIKLNRTVLYKKKYLDKKMVNATHTHGICTYVFRNIFININLRLWHNNLNYYSHTRCTIGL